CTAVGRRAPIGGGAAGTSLLDQVSRGFEIPPGDRGPHLTLQLGHFLSERFLRARFGPLHLAPGLGLVAGLRRLEQRRPPLLDLAVEVLGIGLREVPRLPYRLLGAVGAALLGRRRAGG